MKPIVAKFGGTSLADATQIRKVVDIVHADLRRKFVVVSAPGIRFKGDHKVTDLLIAYTDEQHPIRKNMRRSAVLEEIATRFTSIAMELNVDVPEIEQTMDFLDELTRPEQHYHDVVSRGEYLTAKIVALATKSAFMDARGLLMFDEKHNADYTSATFTYNLDASREKVARLLEGEGRFVIPGFYGTRRSNGTVCTFSRGGSDLSGAYVAELIDAEVYENWTDVSGLRMTDPRVVENPAHVPILTFAEARELTYMGANVLHDAVSVPLVRAQIPLVVRNTNEPDGATTRIVPSLDGVQRSGQVTGIAGKQDFTVITVHKLLVNDQIGFLRDVSGVFAAQGVSIDHAVTLIDGVSIAVRADTLTGNARTRVLAKLQSTCTPDSVDIDEEISLICTVGHGMRRKTGVSAKLYTALANAGVNADLQLQAGGELTIIVGVTNENYENAIRAIYNAFVPSA